MGRPKTEPQHCASTPGPEVLLGRTGIQGLSRALRAGARGLFRSPQPAGGGAGSWDAWPFLQRLLEVLPVSGSTGHQGNARPTSLPAVTHSVAAHPHLTRWPCRAVPSLIWMRHACPTPICSSHCSSYPAWMSDLEGILQGAHL